MIAERLDEVIDAEARKAQHLTDERQRVAAERELKEGKAVKNKTLNAHVDSCPVCEPLPERPARCQLYTHQAERLGKRLGDAIQQERDAATGEERVSAQVALSQAHVWKQSILVSHVVKCSTCE
ncbi:hypothetical protein [Streptomyces sp. NPDC005970]|uniref:hypothetical protein n=1 Tax=Streptomyces sp. NPDC005970 TaxID=3156723 RepID=UPI0033DC32BA